MYLIICTRVVTFVQLSLKKRNIRKKYQSVHTISQGRKKITHKNDSRHSCDIRRSEIYQHVIEYINAPYIFAGRKKTNLLSPQKIEKWCERNVYTEKNSQKVSERKHWSRTDFCHCNKLYCFITWIIISRLFDHKELLIDINQDGSVRCTSIQFKFLGMTPVLSLPGFQVEVFRWYNYYSTDIYWWIK